MNASTGAVTVEDVGTGSVTATVTASGNPNASVSATVTFDASPKKLYFGMMSPFVKASKTYDGTTVLSDDLVSSLNYTGVINDDDVIMRVHAELEDAEPGINNKTYTVTYLLSGADASKYVVGESGYTRNNGTVYKRNVLIEPAPQTITYGDPVNSGPQWVQVATGSNYDSLLDGDVIATATVSSTDTNAGNMRMITASGVTITRNGVNVTDAYYTVDASTTNNNLTILRRQLGAEGTAVASKVYDGTISASVSGYKLTNVAPRDEGKITLTASAAFADANVGTGKEVTVTYALQFGAGVRALNYTVAGTSQILSADITPRPITVTVADQNLVYGDAVAGGMDKITVTGNGLIEGDLVQTVTFDPTEGTMLDAGTYELNVADLRIVRDGIDVTANYAVTPVAGVLFVDKASQNAPDAVAATAETQYGKSDGSITGVSDAMEYRLVGGDVWSSVAADAEAVGGLAPGVYEVRVAGDANHYPSDSVTVVVAQGVEPAKPTSPDDDHTPGGDAPDTGGDASDAGDDTTDTGGDVPDVGGDASDAGSDTSVGAGGDMSVDTGGDTAADTKGTATGADVGGKATISRTGADISMWGLVCILLIVAAGAMLSIRRRNL
ncbi:YDG domain-containing protein [Bifidobacterium eulemuris]|uniref:YDG domain-containing protein n=1 Tax=Bifidobacterium eulemuris TaxID=1765219 RepID=UPI001B80497E|nr:YDG domain-containing protein [Bifidobacterium eulemuris]